MVGEENAGDRNRTGMPITERGILSPLRLPISPLRQLVKRGEVTQIRNGWQGGCAMTGADSVIIVNFGIEGEVQMR